MNGSIAQPLNKLKHSLNATILNLLFIEREIRLLRAGFTHEAQFGPHKITSQALQDITEAKKDNETTDDYLTLRFRDVSMEGVNVCG